LLQGKVFVNEHVLRHLAFSQVVQATTFA